jgi:hypothetical protein
LGLLIFEDPYTWYYVPSWGIILKMEVDGETYGWGRLFFGGFVKTMMGMS